MTQRPENGDNIHFFFVQIIFSHYCEFESVNPLCVCVAWSRECFWTRLPLYVDFCVALKTVYCIVEAKVITHFNDFNYCIHILRMCWGVQEISNKFSFLQHKTDEKICMKRRIFADLNSSFASRSPSLWQHVSVLCGFTSWKMFRVNFPHWTFVISLRSIDDLWLIFWQHSESQLLRMTLIFYLPRKRDGSSNHIAAKLS